MLKFYIVGTYAPLNWTGILISYQCYYYINQVSSYKNVIATYFSTISIDL